MSLDLPPMPVEQATIAYYEQAPANRSAMIMFPDGATYTMKLVPNKFDKDTKVCVVLVSNRLNSIVWETVADEFTMTPAPQSQGAKTGEQGDFVFDACAHMIITEKARR